MSDHYTGLILEDINHKFDIMIEALSLTAKSSELKVINERLIDVENDVKLIYKIVSDESQVTRKHTSTLSDHEIRITDLEDEDNLEYA